MDWAKQVRVPVGVLVGVGVVALVAFGLNAPPEVDPAMAAAVLPVVDEELERGPWRGLLESTRPELGPRWFCDERVIEIRRTGDEVAVGVTAVCQEYAPAGKSLLAGSGERGPKVVVLLAGPDGYRVSGVDDPPDGTASSRWVAENFTEEGAAEVDRRTLSVESPLDQALEAFGLPADAPVRDA